MNTSSDRLSSEGGLFSQPKAVWAVAFACVISFMGMGLVDPILPAISNQLHASGSQVSLLFSSYTLVTGLMMLITGFISSRIGPKRTMIVGIAFIIAFSAFAGMSGSVWEIVGFRGGWGLGNALFIATALTAIVGLSTGGTAKAIILYEAALGLGISVGPLLGGELGSISWRGPFFGVSVLMSFAFIAILALLPRIPKPKARISIADPFKALKYPGLLTLGIVALFYNFGFFTLLAYTPLVMELGIHQLGYVFFGWGVALAITSVIGAPKLAQSMGAVRALRLMLLCFALDLAAMGVWHDSKTALVILVIVAGLFLGVVNTLLTTVVMGAAPVERSVASASYNFVRFVGGAIGPWLANKLHEWFDSVQLPFYFGAFIVILGIVVTWLGRRALSGVDTSGGH
ncbi:MFS transporter [Cohnella nanjingensis]|uniref:MFS transporter n=2 Tax=Cohnella nanjingensis TaxID=1387779 RepID=A0A7X0RWL9_9BACL|nr:MFS transporter [Cohnella nanjingensis]MBB6674998.1 MFS transporter [Cohnella nanjingensis]